MFYSVLSKEPVRIMSVLLRAPAAFDASCYPLEYFATILTMGTSESFVAFLFSVCS